MDNDSLSSNELAINSILEGAPQSVAHPANAPTSLPEAAAWYAAAGFDVIPLHYPIEGGGCSCHKGTKCGKSTGKHPIESEWETRPPKTPENLRDLWAQRPRMNIGLRMGNGRIAIDRDGEAGRATLATLEAELGPLPSTMTDRSGRVDGGEHRIFTVPADVKIKNSAGVLGPGVDVRGDGGQIVIAPSVHASGAPYAWMSAPDVEPAPLPAAWLARLLETKRKASKARKATRATAADLPTRVAKRFPGDERFAALLAGGGVVSSGSRHDAVRDMTYKLAHMVPQPSAADVSALFAPSLATMEREAIAAGGRMMEPAEVEALYAGALAKVRPAIEVWPGEIHAGVDASIAALAENDGELFQREGALARVVRAPEDSPEFAKGAPTISAHVAASIRERLTRHARFVKVGTDKDGESTEKQANPPESVVQAVLVRGAWGGVRPLAGVIETPSMRPDGTLIDRPGYDPATGYLYEPNESFPPIAEAPTRDDAASAVWALIQPFCDFPFRLREGETEWWRAADLYVVIAAILTLLVRPAVKGAVPGFVFDASTRGSGKSKLADIVALVATGRKAPRASWPATEEELEKMLGAYALRGASLVNFDNVSRSLAGAPLDKVLTANGKVDLRILGKSEVPSLPWNAVVLFSGNNVTIEGDTARRVLSSRLESPLEKPEERNDFRFPDVLAHVASERTRLVPAALTILRAFVIAGRPSSGLTWGSYEEWTALVAGAIRWAAGADVLAARPADDDGHDPAKAALAVVLDVLATAPEGFTAAELLAASPAISPELRAALETLSGCEGDRLDARAAGKALRKHVGRVIANRSIHGRAGRGGVFRWSAK